jgi:hypothetical protein
MWGVSGVGSGWIAGRRRVFGVRGGEGQLTRVHISSLVQEASYVSPLVEIFGDIFIGENSFLASNTILRATPEQMLKIGN